MERGRSLVVVLGAVAFAVLLVGAALWILGDDAAPAPIEPEPDPVPEPEITTLSVAEARRMHHARPWPFADFKDDITSAKKPGRREVFYERYELEAGHAEVMVEKRITLSMTDTTVQGVVAELRKFFEPYGLEVFTGPPHLPDDVRFDLRAEDLNVNQVIGLMFEATQERIDYEVVPKGLAIGSFRFVQQARLDAKEWESRQRQVHAEVDDSILDVEYRPDFREAHIGAVARDITEKTGIETVVGRRLWAHPVSITWRTDPLPLGEALAVLGEKVQANYHVREGRIFLVLR